MAQVKIILTDGPEPDSFVITTEADPPVPDMVKHWTPSQKAAGVLLALAKKDITYARDEGKVKAKIELT
jgi:hypothetical protein